MIEIGLIDFRKADIEILLTSHNDNQVSGEEVFISVTRKFNTNP